MKDHLAADTCHCFAVLEFDFIFLFVSECVECLCFQVKSNDDLLAVMAGGNPASSSAVSKTKRTASIGTSANNLDSKPKTTSGISKISLLDINFIFCYVVSLEM